MTEKNLHVPRFTKLTLGGFQTFDEINELPLRRLTMLFGPNSAGKSAVEDGLRAFARLVRPEGSFAMTGMIGFDQLAQHFRHLSGSPLTYAPTLTLGLAGNFHSPGLTFHPKFKTHTRKPFDKLFTTQPGPIEYVARFPNILLDGESEPMRRVGHDVEISINNKPLLKIAMQDRVGINTRHHACSVKRPPPAS